MKIVLVAIFAPDTNYTRDLSVYFNNILKKGDRLYLCGRKDEVILDKKLPKVDHVWRYGWKYFFDVLAYVKKVHPDVVHLQHEFKTYGGLITAVLFPLLLICLRAQGYPIVITVHGIVDPKQVDKEFLVNFNVKPTIIHKVLVLGFFHYVYKSILLIANNVTVHSPLLKEILSLYFLLMTNKVVVIEHGIREIDDIDSKKLMVIPKKFPIIRGKNIIVVFGHFSPRKGYEILIEAYSKVLQKKKMHNWLLALVGDVQPEFKYYWDKIVTVIKSHKLENNVLMTDFVKDAEIDEFFRSAAIVLIPAVVSFNTSGALSLALAYKKPLLVANVKPLAEEVKSNDFGLLYDIKGRNSLENQLEKMMVNESLYDKLKSKLTQSVTKRYWTNIAKEHYQLYQKLISNK